MGGEVELDSDAQLQQGRRYMGLARIVVESLLYSALLMGLQTGLLIYCKFIIVRNHNGTCTHSACVNS